MKKCPKCGAENAPDSPACCSCYAPLEGVDVTATAETPEPAPSAQPEGQPAPPTPAPAGAEQPAQAQPVTPPPGPQQPLAQPPGAYQPPPGAPHYPRRGEFPRPTPVRQSSAGLVAVIIAILAIGGAFAGWWFFLRERSPVDTVRSMIATFNNGGDLERAKKYLTKSSVAILENPMFSAAYNRAREQAERMRASTGTKLSKRPNLQEGKDFALELVSQEKDKATVKIKPGTVNASEWSQAPASLRDGVPIILLKEDGKWKVDLVTTVMGLMGPFMQEMMKHGGNVPGAFQFGPAPGMPGVPSAPTAPAQPSMPAVPRSK